MKLSGYALCVVSVMVGGCLAGGDAAARTSYLEFAHAEGSLDRAESAPAAEPDKDVASDEFETVRIAGPFRYPWSIGFLPDGSFLVTERPGRLNRVRPGRDAEEVAGLADVLGRDVLVMLDVAIDPGFAHNRTIYLSYGYGRENRSTLRVARARLDTAAARLVAARVIFESLPVAKAEQYGGRIALADDGHVFVTVGDRWERDHAQDLSDPAGKIVRLRADGTVPPDNPFVGVVDARPEIWSVGHRNPLGIAFEPQSGRLWSHENGPLGGDELNLIHKGANYGWPVISYGLDYSGEVIGDGIVEKEGMERPFHAWLVAVAPSGLAVERRGAKVVFWIGALAGRALIQLEMEGDLIVSERRLLHGELGRIRDVRIGPDGFLYVVTDNEEGGVYRLDPVIDQAARRSPRQPL